MVPENGYSALNKGSELSIILEEKEQVFSMRSSSKSEARAENISSRVFANFARRGEAGGREDDNDDDD